MPRELVFIGAGNMAEAILRGLLRGGEFSPSQIIAVDPSQTRCELFEREFSVRTSDDAATAVTKDAAVVLLCTKPQQAGAALASIAATFGRDALLISIAAGITSGFIESKLKSVRVDRPRVIRTMPNTPMLVGAGIVAIAAGAHATADDLQLAQRLFEPSAKVLSLDESKLDAVTAVSGSGPAYFFYLVEQMTAAGIANGLTADEASALARQTAIGAGQMLARLDDSAAVLRQKVTSPGGTTQAALERFDALNVDAAILDALTAAAKRAGELSRAAK